MELISLLGTEITTKNAIKALNTDTSPKEELRLTRSPLYSA